MEFLIFCQEVRRGENSISETQVLMRFRSILAFKWWCFFCFGTIIKPFGYTLFQYTSQGIVPFPYDVGSHQSSRLGLRWKCSLLRFFRQRLEMNGSWPQQCLHKKKPPGVPLLILCNLRMRQQKYAKKHVQSSPWLAVHGFKQFHLFWWLLSVKKISLVYVSGVFCLPQAEVFKGTDACCVPVLNPSEAVGVLSCWVVECATNFHGWISWILFCKAVHEHNRLRRSFLAQVFKAKMLRFLIPMYPNFLASP